MTTIGKWLGITVIAAVSTVAGLAYTAVHDDELVIVTSFGKIVQGPLEPGIHWYTPYFNVVRRYPTTRQFLLITDKSIEPRKPFIEAFFDEGITITTADKIPMSVVVELSYRIQKSPNTVKAFVADFGRSSTEYGTEKIEKLVADSCRTSARSVLANVPLKEAETEIDKNSDQIRAHAMEQRAQLRSLGVSIVTLGYRLRVDKQVNDSRIKESIKTQQEEARLRTISAKAEADRAEVQASLELAQKRLELARLERAAFDASAESSPQKLRQTIVQKWNGAVPTTLLLGNDQGTLVDDLISDARSQRSAPSARPPMRRE